MGTTTGRGAEVTRAARQSASATSAALRVLARQGLAERGPGTRRRGPAALAGVAESTGAADLRAAKLTGKLAGPDPDLPGCPPAAGLGPGRMVVAGRSGRVRRDAVPMAGAGRGCRPRTARGRGTGNRVRDLPVSRPASCRRPFFAESRQLSGLQAQALTVSA